MDPAPARRRLWLPPASIREVRAAQRRVGTLELFFDLVFVVLVATLADHLAQDPTWLGFAWFAFLFFLVWTSWLNGSFYHDAHATNDLSIRVITFAQMLALSCMAAFLGAVPGQGNTGFAWAYAINTLILAAMWLRTGLHDPGHRAGAYPYSGALLVAAVLFAVSTWTQAPLLTWLWVVAVAVQAAAAIPAVRILRREFGEVTATPALAERFGLMVIIVIGEVVAGAISGMAARPVGANAALVLGALGVLLAVAYWWLYFDLVSERAHQRGRGLAWMYLHVPLIIGIAGSSAAVLAAVRSAQEPPASPIRWLTVGCVALSLMCLAGLTRAVDDPAAEARSAARAQLALVTAVVLLVIVGCLPVSPAWTLVLVLAALALPVAASVPLWLASQ